MNTKDMSTEDYYKTIAGCLKWEDGNYAIYNGCTICAHPEKGWGDAPVTPTTQGCYTTILLPEEERYDKLHSSICNPFIYNDPISLGKPIWKILMEIDKNV